MNEEWLDKGTYLLSTAPQGTELWKKQRVGLITGSNSLLYSGFSRYSPSFRDRARLCAGVKEQKFDDASLKRMKIGSDLEAYVRRWYCDKFNVKVEEIGLAKLKRNPILGSSLDGIIRGKNGDKGIEIKVSDQIYPCSFLKSAVPPKTLEELENFYIKPEHYIQMLQGIEVCNLTEIDYIVGDYKTGDIFVTTVYPNKELFVQLEIVLMDFYERGVKPLMNP